MLIESETFERKIGGRSPKADVGDTVFRYCTFAGLEESAMVSSVFIGCTFEDSTWCMELFNCAVLVDCRFTRCAFEDVSFRGCKFVECVFTDCLFDDACLFDSEWYGCTQERCTGLDTAF